MPISAQEWRVRTGLFNASKGTWISSQKKNPGKQKSTKWMKHTSQTEWHSMLMEISISLVQKGFQYIVFIFALGSMFKRTQMFASKCGLNTCMYMYA